MTPSDSVRASDNEREAAVERLRVASVDGRLTFGELTERTEAAYTAVTRADLEKVTADLPDAHPQAAPVVSGSPGQDRRWVVAVMGDTKRRGRWRVDHVLGAVAVMGDVVLDLREAQVPSGAVDIVATAVMGDVKIIVPDGVEVELTGVAVMGDKTVRVREAPPDRSAPVVRVKAYAVMGDVKILDNENAQPLRRAISAWLHGGRDEPR